MTLRSISDSSDWAGKKVLLRLSLNVPIENGEIQDDYRLIKSLPTLQYLIDQGALVTVISHIGSDGEQSLAPVEEWLRSRLSAPGAKWAPEALVLRENLRRDPREKAGDVTLAEELAKGQDIFVNEDFAVSHRAHASVVGLPKFLPSYVGLQFAEEIKHLSEFLDPPAPCVVILGGAKIETKLPMITAFLPKADKIFLGSYFANEASEIPNDSKVVIPADGIEKDGHILDVGKHALDAILQGVNSAASIIWNGPLGKFEAGFDETTQELARTIAQTSAKTVVGGGDSISAIRKLNLLDKFTFVSTGGGAMLEFLSHGSLPGIEAILQSPYN